MNTNLWQSKDWAAFQNRLGRKVYVLENQQTQLLAVRFPLFCCFNWLDVPRGPVDCSSESIENLEHLIQTAQKSHTVFIRIMPTEEFKIGNLKFKICEAHNNHHPETTLKLNLSLSEEALLDQMKPKGRYNLKLAEKKGVIVRESKDVAEFFQLLQQTTERNRFWGHSQKYYATMLSVFGKNAQLLLAEYEGKILAGGIFIYTSDEAIYYYGASGNQDRNVMAPYLLQWTAILEAKKRGCLWYDFLGIAPENADQKHPWAGVTDFKKKFGGEVVTYPPAQEIILRPFLYRLFLMLKKIKSFLH